ncbi:MAG: GDP-mannose 4,6-dehydratase [Acidobacteria bacterium]|nr:MAG: GDP-mannose 4,6-dehydratase [Acidobacteriota bacterium]
MARRKAFITGITGQDGSYLAEILLEKGYEVYGMIRRSSSFNTARIDHIFGELELVFGDLGDGSSLNQLLRTIRPDEVYNLGAQSHVRVSFDIPEYTADVAALGTLRLLDAIREEGVRCRFYEAGSSEMFGQVRETPQTEETPFHPRSPYGVAKVFGHYITVNYRESHRIFACSAMGFNHESPRRGLEFVTRKVTHEVAKIKCGLAKKLTMGNLDAKRDWGFAGDYVRAMWIMLQQAEPDDYVLATGKMHSVRELLEFAFGAVGLHWEKHVEIDPKLLRPAEVDCLCGNASKAREKLGWEPEVTFEELIKMMVEADLETVRAAGNGNGYAVAAVRSGA